MRDCLDSLVNQTLDDLEIILVNDESPDDSVAIIEEYQRIYPNIKLINQKNSGGAVAGNNGLTVATGEYVTLMDSDDVVPLDAYEKLYNKAKESNADIVIGKAKILVNGELKEVLHEKERDVWKKEREITDLLQFPDIFYDGFYWNKIYRREFLFKYDCFMPPGMLYADRPMVHKAFLYANKIEIITDVVYYWRKRGETGAKSITQLKGDINNFRDRMESLYYQLDYIEAFGNEQIKTEFIKRNLERLFFPIKSIVIDEEFRDVYLAEVKEFLVTVSNVYDNDIGIIRNLYIYMILNDLTNELVEFLQTDQNGAILEEDGIYYWALPYFQNPDVSIPDQFFKVNVLQRQFIKIEQISVENGFIHINDISYPDAFSVDQVKIEIISRLDDRDKAVYEVKRNKENLLAIEIPLKSYQTNNLYDIYIVFCSKDREDQFRIFNKMLNNRFKKLEFFHENVKRELFFEGGKLSYIVVDTQLKSIKLDEEKVSIDVLEPETDLTFFLKSRGSKDTIYFHQQDDGRFVLPWNHFIEPNRTFDLFIKIFKKGVRLHINQIPKYQAQKVIADGFYNELYKTENNNISLKTSTTFRKSVRRLLGQT